jgi:hypothetical protein
LRQGVPSPCLRFPRWQRIKNQAAIVPQSVHFEHFAADPVTIGTTSSWGLSTAFQRQAAGSRAAVVRISTPSRKNPFFEAFVCFDRAAIKPSLLFRVTFCCEPACKLKSALTPGLSNASASE